MRVPGGNLPPAVKLISGWKPPGSSLPATWRRLFFSHSYSHGLAGGLAGGPLLMATSVGVGPRAMYPPLRVTPHGESSSCVEVPSARLPPQSYTKSKKDSVGEVTPLLYPHTKKTPLLSPPLSPHGFPPMNPPPRGSKPFSTKNIRGRLFYKRRPKQIPKLKKKNWRSKWLEGAPQKRGICLKVRVQTPKKPNSGLKKIARVRLSTGRIVSVYIPGIGHNLNTHNIILVRGGRCKDIPGCNYKAIRGVYDLLPVKNRLRGRSKYGVKLSEEKKKHLLERYNLKHIYIKKDVEQFNKYKWFNWFSYADGEKNLRQKPLEEDEPVPINIFHFNTHYRNRKVEQSRE
ncbi:unnamed protein product [Plasmodium vivax]|nr:hypothetical protein PVIIG_02468 [Plasmodium vivax India VII]CAG9483357.1 unnamed protein product [Plasmodium vivax]CAI7718161.1 ribosomal protein S12, mitochondrial, putative [Plasmodium vivax]SCO65349.1 30S ribosomal protein S12, putative [Plasmodium vivax]